MLQEQPNSEGGRSVARGPADGRQPNGRGTGGITAAQFKEAERGFRAMLARRFSASWINENSRDLLAQAMVEYSEWLRVNPPACNPVGWLLTCAYRRAINLLDSQTRRPRAAPLDSAVELADDRAPTPEEEVLDAEREERLRAAMAVLPKRELQLLSLVYFEGLSIREAGRRVGWAKSAADRHHAAALDKLRALVGDRRYLSSASVAVVAWGLTQGEDATDRPRELLELAGRAQTFALDVLDALMQRLADLARRLSPFADPAAAGASASGGAGRLIAQCGIAVGAAACSLLSAPVVQLEGSATPTSPAPKSPSVPKRMEPAQTRPFATPKSAQPIHSTPASKAATPRGASDDIQVAARPKAVKERHASEVQQAAAAPEATGQQASSEFGDANFRTEPASPAGSASSAAPDSSNDRAVAQPPTRRDADSGAARADQEFGL